ncbi:MAG: GNAT family N-acetyltransferase [Deltaproteobacteria bacterium]|nr:GNAT family N-acetyltransferase [Deltaproteobacteria bacterium]
MADKRPWHPAQEKVMGFVTAISDGILSACIPLLEVLPEYQSQGIGLELMKRIIAEYKDFYMMDLTCGPETQPFYTRLGMAPATGMMIRRYDRQSGRGKNQPA